ncbi:MAG: PadR family transcriptional regulator [Oscillatoriophycideae cyanobacterium NC_groundwater_1537_Pr4_S-0.65um_50_18]|nr:PadR family transcriptional regulator [Oscillatoriophycideae cyanobacterium NC_groundwater_1537_Pr4_S-0.65um_50_18]
MSLAHVILGLLQQQERTGYDLKTECFNQCIAHLWQADQAQIYRTLDKLEAQGWIVCTVEIQHDRPNRKVFQITESGKAEFIRWLQTHQPLPILRDPLLAQLHFAAQLPNEAIVHLLEQELEARREKLAECEAVDVPSLDDPIASRDQKMHRLVLELVTQREQTYLNWLQKAIEIIQIQPSDT